MAVGRRRDGARQHQHGFVAPPLPKREVGQHRQGADIVRRCRQLLAKRPVGIGELARGYGGIWFPDRAAALQALPDLVRPGDAVLVKGSRSMGLEELVEAIAP